MPEYFSFVDLVDHHATHEDGGADEIALTASQITWTAGKLLMGTGVGSDPAEIDAALLYASLL